jgi:hypothetical protein
MACFLQYFLRMEKIDILVKGVPVPTHNMFKGLCSMAGTSVSEGVIEAMGDWIAKNSGGIGEAADKARAARKR